MRRVNIYLLIIVFLLSISCNSDKIRSYMPGAMFDRGEWFETVPFGMVFVQRGAFQLGEDENILIAPTPKKTVTVEAFWMDDTEITNNEYRQFVYYVRDSIARKLLGEVYSEFTITEDWQGAMLEEPLISWEKPIKWNNSDYQDAMDDMYVPEEERQYFGKALDTRKYQYEYYFVDLKEAAKSRNAYNYKTKKYDGYIKNDAGEFEPITSRRSFIKYRSVSVYPDTLCWMRDFDYTYNEPFTLQYFSHVAFDDYPVVGVSWKQANAFCHWRTETQVAYSKIRKETPSHDYRLPTEVEWEYAARGERQNSLYPWGSYYTRNKKGCFVANFKPLRGNYIADSGTTTTAMEVGSYNPNSIGLYDMAGNVAEWTSTAYFESGYELISDFNPQVDYNATEDEPLPLKRKVVRGGSWKDVAHFIQTGTRSFEYQDSARSYIGFRCVRTSFRNELQDR